MEICDVKNFLCSQQLKPFLSPNRCETHITKIIKLQNRHFLP